MARDKTPGIPGKTVEPGGAIANLTLASLPDPRLSPADRGVIFYRPRNFDRAFADFSPAKPAEKPRRARSASGPAAAMRSIPSAASERPLVPVPRQRPLAQDPSRLESLAFVRPR